MKPTGLQIGRNIIAGHVHAFSSGQLAFDTVHNCGKL